MPDDATVIKIKSSNMNKHMKIVVIGGSGLIGKELTPGENPRLGPTRFEDWLSHSIPQKSF